MRNPRVHKIRGETEITPVLVAFSRPPFAGIAASAPKPRGMGKHRIEKTSPVRVYFPGIRVVKGRQTE
jgi:hypothetical protein